MDEVESNGGFREKIERYAWVCENSDIAILRALIGSLSLKGCDGDEKKELLKSLGAMIGLGKDHDPNKAA